MMYTSLLKAHGSRLTAALLFLAVSSLANAQEKEYMYEIGFGGGASWGYGDLNQSKALYNPAAAFDLLFRYNLNLRWAVAVDFSSYGIQGDGKDFDSQLPIGKDVQYDRRLWQLGFRPEFTFWNYGWGADFREKKRVAPFLTMGLGFGLASGDVSPEVNALDAEGRPVGQYSSDTSFGMSIPMGLGIKWKMAPRWNAQLTCLFTKCFNDEVDGLKDCTGIETSGMMKNDWTGSLMLSVTFDFKERCVECHNQANQAR